MTMAKRDADGVRRRRTTWAMVIAVLLVAGGVLAATAGGSVARGVLAIVLLGTAGVIVAALAFLEVGLSEERDERRGRFGRPGGPGRLPEEDQQRAARFHRD